MKLSANHNYYYVRCTYRSSVAGTKLNRRSSAADSASLFTGYGTTANVAGGGMGGPPAPRPRPSSTFNTTTPLHSYDNARPHRRRAPSTDRSVIFARWCQCVIPSLGQQECDLQTATQSVHPFLHSSRLWSQTDREIQTTNCVTSAVIGCTIMRHMWRSLRIAVRIHLLHWQFNQFTMMQYTDPA